LHIKIIQIISFYNGKPIYNRLFELKELETFVKYRS